MKKFFLTSFVALLGSVAIQAAPITAVYTLPASCSTNLPTLLGTNVSFILLSAVVTSPANNAAAITVYDWYTNSTQRVTPAYSNSAYFATNYITMYTNYYGYTNWLTNIALVDYTNVTVAATNPLTADYQWSAPTNTSIQFLGLNNRFQFGAFVTNTSSGTVTLTLQYSY